MREIKFRGKFVYSFTGCDFPWIYGMPTGQLVGNKIPLDGAEVLYDTVGQYTGLHDKNGNEIYEGDIVKSTEYKDSNYVVEFKDGMFYANVEPCNEGVYGGYPLWILCAESQCEIVGNIFDNKDLLKKKK